MTGSQPNDSPALNPYAAPQADVLGIPTAGSELSHAEQVRQAHLKHEASIKSFALLYFIGGGLWVLIGVTSLVVGVGEALTASGQERLQNFVLMLLLGGAYGSFGVLQLAIGRGLRQLTPMGKIGGIMFGLLGLLAFPLGTIISGYFLYLLCSQKGQLIFSPQYKQIIRETPHLAYKTSKVLWALLIILSLVLSLLAFLAIFA